MRILYYLILCLCFNINLHAQKANTSSGGNAIGTGGTVCYSVGQINFSTIMSTTGSVSQGVQQPFEIFALTGVDDAKELSINLSAFPNPIVDYLTLTIESASAKNLTYQLFDTNGKLITSQKSDGLQTKISMINYAAATYFITVIENNKPLKTFKIIKN